MGVNGFIFDQGSQNTAALGAFGTYIELVPPSASEAPAASSVALFVGTGSWGPVNQALGPVSSTGNAEALVGAWNVNLWLTDPYDLMRGVMQSIGEAQAQGAAILEWLIRISDGTDAAAQIVLDDTTSGTPLSGITLPAKWTGIGGNTIQVQISAGAGSHNYNVQITGTPGGQTIVERYQNIAGSASGPSPFWTNLKNALTLGTQTRGPSQLIGAPTLGSGSAINPALGTFTLAGGSDGRSGVTSATFFGSDVAGNRTGVYAGRGLPLVPAYFHCCGLTDTTKIGTLQGITNSEIMRYIFPNPSGTSTSAAVTERNTAGISDKRFMYSKDWIYWNDPVSGQTIFTDPTAILIGLAASLSPQLSPLNKQVFTVIGSERGNVQYQQDESLLLEENGIWVIANPCLGSPFWGIINSTTTSLNPAEQPVEYERLKDYVAIQFQSDLNKFLGQPQGPTDPDPTRMACKNDIDSTMEIFANASPPLILNWESKCDASLYDSNLPGRLNATLEYTEPINITQVFLKIGTSQKLPPGQAVAAAQQGGG